MATHLLRRWCVVFCLSQSLASCFHTLACSGKNSDRNIRVAKKLLLLCPSLKVLNSLPHRRLSLLIYLFLASGSYMTMVELSKSNVTVFFTTGENFNRLMNIHAIAKSFKYFRTISPLFRTS